MEIKEIDETSNKQDADADAPIQTPELNPKTGRTKSAEVEVHLYRQGKGPIDVFKSTLGGWDQDQLEVRDILDKYGLKSIFAFNPGSGRGVPIRFNRRNGRSMLGYRGGSIICIDGEPQDSLIKPVTKIILGIAVITLLITFMLKEPPEWIKNTNIFATFPPWVLACVVIVFTRMRKRTKNFFQKYGW